MRRYTSTSTKHQYINRSQNNDTANQYYDPDAGVPDLDESIAASWSTKSSITDLDLWCP